MLCTIEESYPSNSNVYGVIPIKGIDCVVEKVKHINMYLEYITDDIIDEDEVYYTIHDGDDIEMQKDCYEFAVTFDCSSEAFDLSFRTRVNTAIDHIRFRLLEMCHPEYIGYVHLCCQITNDTKALNSLGENVRHERISEDEYCASIILTYHLKYQGFTMSYHGDYFCGEDEDFWFIFPDKFPPQIITIDHDACIYLDEMLWRQRRITY